MNLLKKNLLEFSLEQFKRNLFHYSFFELAEGFAWLSEESTPDSQKKLESLFQFVDSPTTLEVLAKHFSLSHFFSFLNFLNRHPSYQDRLIFILAGLQPSVFSKALHAFQGSHLDLLKHESLLEPLQYHILQFVHQGESLHQQVEQEIEQFKEEIRVSNIKELTLEKFNSFIRCIERYQDAVLNYLNCAKTALSIVWNTNRIDLIEKVSAIYEKVQHLLNFSIGHRSSHETPSTGLYLFLENHFSSIFDLSLQDEDAALEGLTRLSIWYLKDYWELGLLPFIKGIEELDANSKPGEEGRRTYQEHLFSIVQQQLRHLKIYTVGDLKKNHLFSKSLFKAYINQNRHCLISAMDKNDRYNP